jgi:flagellar biosynthesis component FlhA
MKKQLIVALAAVVAVGTLITAAVLVNAYVERADAANRALASRLQEEKQARLDEKKEREAEKRAQEQREADELAALTDGYKDVTVLESSVKRELSSNMRDVGLPTVKDIGCAAENERNTRFSCHVEYRGGETSTLTVTVDADGSGWVSRREQ